MIRSDVYSDLYFIDYDPGYFSGYGQISILDYVKEDKSTGIVDVDGKPFVEAEKRKIGFY